MQSRWIFIALAACSPVFAQTTQQDAALLTLLEGTIYAIDHRETADGKLKACGLEFNVIGRDNSTRGGAGVQGVGSYYLRRMGGNIGYALKLGVRDGIGQQAVPFAPMSAFVRPVRGNGPTRKPIRADSDTPGYALYVGAVDDDAINVLRAIVEQRKIVVGFNRKAGQQDVNLEVDLSVKEARLEGERLVRDRSVDMVDAFSACIGDLMK